MAKETAGRDQSATPSIDQFLDQPTRDLGHWAWLWEGDQRFPIRGSRGILGRGKALLKRLLRPFLRLALAETFDRQRVFNLILIETLERQRHSLRSDIDGLRQHIEAIHHDHQSAIEAHAERLVQLDRRLAQSLQDVMKHNDALVARLDQKLDRYRREARTLSSQLGAFIAARQAEPPQPLAAVQREQTYLALELRHRGSEEEIGQRVNTYLPFLKHRGLILDLGCGRGEALAVLNSHGYPARGIDSSSEMVGLCMAKGLDAVNGQLFDYLTEEVDPDSLGGVVSFHVIEHLPADSLERLVRLAWRALAPGGVLILETPSPLSVVMAARDFWTDPTHLRPVHPASLEVAYREAGFEPVHRLDLHPFPTAQQLPQIDLGDLPASQRQLGDQVNRLRDRLDELLHGHRDYALIGVKPA